MQVRRVAAVASLAVLAVGAYAPAVAAPKPFTGSYSVTLSPDPAINAYSTAGKKNCFTLNPSSVDSRTVKFPRAGRVTIVLDSAQSTPAADWDLYVLNKDEDFGSSSGATAHEEVVGKLKKAAELTINVCNLTGAPTAKVTYTLTAK